MRLLFLHSWLVLFLFLGCKRENRCDCVKGTGKKTTEVRKLEGFTRIYMEGKLDVYFTQSYDSTYGVSIEGGANLLGLIRTKVMGDTLRISNDNKCNWMRNYKKGGIKVFVKAPHIYFIENYAAGDFQCENTITENILDYSVRSAGNVNLNVNCNQAIGHMHGSGDVNISGQAHEHDVHATGQGFVNATDLSTFYTWIHYNSSGEAKVQASGKLVALIYASGNVYYTGNPPSLETALYGSGKVIPY